MWSIGVISIVLREKQMWTQVIKKTSQKNVQKRLIFQTLSSISPKNYVFFLPPYAWLESYGRHGSFGTNISGSLSFSPVLWVLSSRNTLNVTHSDTASYVHSCRALQKVLYYIILYYIILLYYIIFVNKQPRQPSSAL